MKENRQAGSLILRTGIGILFIVLGILKLKGGMATWTFLGGTLKTIGITQWPAFWGFMAAITELLGGLALVTGLLIRPSALILLLTMIMATIYNISSGADFGLISYPIAMSIVMVHFIANTRKNI
ncbi:DoxX family protein [Chitinophaga sp. Mgbs1]|uniref:DoxX family protein n=1 Tax=Chitinophaga solisilvae TaxID=1233460 RepID=A0A9Q5DBT5_9BACT|nr:DoxX family protein [Chitinophaga solisilvae]